MPEDIKQNKRFWDQQYSVARAHSGSTDTSISGNSNNSYTGKGVWAPPMVYTGDEPGMYLTTYFRDVTDIGYDNDPPSVLVHDQQDFYLGPIGSGYAIQITNSGPAEAYTTPYDGFGAIICEATPGSTWEWSIDMINIGGPDDVIVDMHILALDEHGNRVAADSAKASGSLQGPDYIPSNKTEYFSRQNVEGYYGQGLTKLYGIAKLADIAEANPIRYLSVRLDINDIAYALEFYNFELNPLDQSRGDRPLIWNSPRLFKPREDFTWSDASLIYETSAPFSNGASAYEYLRVTMDTVDGGNTGLVTYLENLDVKGWRYGPTHGSTESLTNNSAQGGTHIPFPTSWTNGGSFDPDEDVAPGYAHWLLYSGGTPSSNTGPENGIPPLPRDVGNPGRRHFGWKQSSEPSGLGDATGYDGQFSYFYTEASSNAYENRHALRMPKINFTMTSHDETLSFYYHAAGNGYQHGSLKIYHQELGDSFFIPGDTGMPSGLSDYPGHGSARQLTNIKIFDPEGAHHNDYIEVTEINGNDDFPGSITDSWHRAEVDLSELRGLNTHIIFMYSGANGYRADFAIANILISGRFNIENFNGQVFGCGISTATNYDANVTWNWPSTCTFPAG